MEVVRNQPLVSFNLCRVSKSYARRSAHGIGNQYLSVSAYETGTPNTPVGINVTVASNGDIAWSASQAFTGYIIVSDALTPVSI
jgi:hypothetical protein